MIITGVLNSWYVAIWGTSLRPVCNCSVCVCGVFFYDSWCHPNHCSSMCAIFHHDHVTYSAASSLILPSLISTTAWESALSSPLDMRNPDPLSPPPLYPSLLSLSSTLKSTPPMTYGLLLCLAATLPSVKMSASEWHADDTCRWVKGQRHVGTLLRGDCVGDRWASRDLLQGGKCRLVGMCYCATSACLWQNIFV